MWIDVILFMVIWTLSSLAYFINRLGHKNASVGSVRRAFELIFGIPLFIIAAVLGVCGQLMLWNDSRKGRS